uniref:pentapeptide repeat-containing protein n=1 Tax=Scytonema millei TaxID=1245922 RepID=UPI00398BE768
MALTNHKHISLYEEAKAGLSSLVKQTALVGAGFLVMLLLTGGNPPGFVVGLSVCLSIAFVAWSEKKRLTELKGLDISPKKQVPSDPPTTQNIDRRSVIWADFDLNGNYQYQFNKSEIIGDKTQIDRKQRLVWEIVNEGASGRNLSGADLSFANLSDADLSFADLKTANLSFADLSGTDLSGADLSNADLRNAKIGDKTQIDSKWRLVWEIVNEGASGKDLSDANLSDANLSDANLRGADLRGADLRGANLRPAYLSDANLSGAKIDERTKIISKWRLVWEIVNEGASGRNLSG